MAFVASGKLDWFLEFRLKPLHQKANASYNLWLLGNNRETFLILLHHKTSESVETKQAGYMYSCCLCKPLSRQFKCCGINRDDQSSLSLYTWNHVLYMTGQLVNVYVLTIWLYKYNNDKARHYDHHPNNVLVPSQLWCTLCIMTPPYQK